MKALAEAEAESAGFARAEAAAAVAARDAADAATERAVRAAEAAASRRGGGDCGGGGGRGGATPPAEEGSTREELRGALAEPPRRSATGRSPARRRRRGRTRSPTRSRRRTRRCRRRRRSDGARARSGAVREREAAEAKAAARRGGGGGGGEGEGGGGGVGGSERAVVEGGRRRRARARRRFARSAPRSPGASRSTPPSPAVFAALATEEETASGRFPLRTSPPLRPESLAAPGHHPGPRRRARRERGAAKRARVAEPRRGKALFSCTTTSRWRTPPRDRGALSGTQKKETRSFARLLPGDVVAPATRARATWAAHQLAARVEGLASDARASPPRSRSASRARPRGRGGVSLRATSRRSGARRTPLTSRRRRGRRRWRRGRRPRRRAS